MSFRIPSPRVSTLLFFLLFLLTACGGNDGINGYDVSPTVADNVTEYTYIYPGSGYGIDHLDTPLTDTTEEKFNYKIELGTSTRDLFFVFTNVSQSDFSTAPTASDVSPASPAESLADASEMAITLNQQAARMGIGLKDRLDVTLFNSDPQKYAGAIMGNVPARTMSIAPPAPVADAVLDTATFYTEAAATSTVTATCRKVVTDGSKTLNIWVDNNAWATGCSEPNCVTQVMVDAIATKFLQTGADNDIYDWDTNIYGAEWGNHSEPTQISPATANNNITILLFDISNDNSTNGGVLGYFWSKDNWTQASFAYSNERLMFYIDSNLFAEMAGGTWEITDYWPDIMIGTLAHEFQHMINYYQKSVRHGLAQSPTWINEMASEMAEDFVATKIAIDGPRGVVYTDGTSGPSGNIYGRLPRFNSFDYIPLTDWMSGGINDLGDTNVLNSCSNVYAFGAYLARNFGGAAFFQNLVQNNKFDHTAIDAALIAAGFSGENFASVLRKWGVGVLLSDDAGTAVPANYRYNTGGFINTTMNSITYQLGSIDLTNYNFGSQIGPKVYTSLPPSDTSAGIYKASNMYYRVGSGLTGTVCRYVTLPKGSKITAVVR